jgi:hypothetical protein
MRPDAPRGPAHERGLASAAVKPMKARSPGGTKRVRFIGLTATVARPDGAMSTDHNQSAPLEHLIQRSSRTGTRSATVRGKGT